MKYQLISRVREWLYFCVSKNSMISRLQKKSYLFFEVQESFNLLFRVKGLDAYLATLNSIILQFKIYVWLEYYSWQVTYSIIVGESLSQWTNKKIDKIIIAIIVSSTIQINHLLKWRFVVKTPKTMFETLNVWSDFII